MKKTIIFFKLFLLLSQYAIAEQVKGQIGVWHNNQPFAIKVILPKFTKGALANDMIQIKNLPDNFVIDEDDCFCFDINDDRFAYVHAYYYATRQIQEYNSLMNSLGLKKIKNLKIYLQKSLSGTMPHGSADWDKNINLSYSRHAFDVSLITHEIGHEIHGFLIGKKFSDFFEMPSTDDDWILWYHKLGIIEGVANFLSSLHLGSPTIGK
ncbi:MAG: hypothetical protein AAB309_02415 [Deltaproteobacteria bacterium]